MVGISSFWMSLLLSILGVDNIGELCNTAVSSDLECETPSACYELANNLQIEGTQSTFVESTVVLYNSLEQWPNNSSLLSLYGKLNLFYLLNWNLAEKSILNSLSIDNSINNLNCYLFAGWLYSTMLYRDINMASYYFTSAISLISGNSGYSSNYWPYFEYAVFSSHIADNYNRSQEYFEIAITASNSSVENNPFISFFYGLLLKYHLNNATYGEYLIDSAISNGNYLPNIGASNVIFQSILLNSKNKIDEAMRCCEFSLAIMNNTDSNANIFCVNGTNPL